MAVLVLVAALPVTLAFARTHTVEEGDTLSAIAETYGIPLEEPAYTNEISNPN